MPLKQFDLDWWSLKMLEDFSAQQPIAIWNHARGVWEKPETDNIICGHLEPYSETWQPSGTMRNGKVYARQTPVRLINDSESSSLLTLATPTTGEVSGVSLSTSGGENLRTQIAILSGRFADSKVELLRTPAASEAERGHQPEDKARARGGQVTLSGQINFLPTVVARDYSDRRKSENWLGKDLVSTIHEVEETPQTSTWGKFENAIRRWESVMGAAPSPTKPDGRDGQHRLSSEFTEWMMGLPKGWITGHGLSRKDELKACGNGVVPQQAELALKILLEKVVDDVAST